MTIYDQFADPADSPAICGATAPGPVNDYTCTAAPGHEGEHVAHAFVDGRLRPMATWTDPAHVTEH